MGVTVNQRIRERLGARVPQHYFEVLRALEPFRYGALKIEKAHTRRYRRMNAPGDFGWVSARMVGGHHETHHSQTLKRLVEFGFAERKQRGSTGPLIRPSYLYRITAEGRKFLADITNL